MPGMLGMVGHGWAWMNFQGAIAMSKSFSGADLFGMEQQPKRTNSKPEADQSAIKSSSVSII
jgi:hypothetical protein